MGKPPDPEQHLSLELQGLVQGVGFRPHVVQLALLHGLRGTVANSSRGVQLELEGSRQALEAFRWPAGPPTGPGSHRSTDLPLATSAR